MTATTAISVPPAEWTAREGHLPSLDGLRAGSIMLVLIGHFLLPESLIGVSALGVKVFFFVSGLLITRLLFAEWRSNQGVSLRDFYIRRLLRLYPVLIVYMLLVGLVLLMRSQPADPVDAASVFFYFVNYLLVQHELAGELLSLPIGVLWSLSVEEHFYLFAPLAFVLIRGGPRAMLTVALAICAVSLGLRLLYTAVWPGIEDTLLIYRHSETRFDSIAFGVILACLCELPWGRRLMELLATRWALALGVILLLGSFLIRDNYFESTWRFTIQGLALFPIVVALVFAQPVRLFNVVLNLPAIAWVGRLSYSLYVWHGGVLFFFRPWIGNLVPPYLGIAELILTFVLAVASYYIVERPVLRLRKHFRRGKEPKPVSGFAARA
jgi:peptidoglycan/LPS O-acetylase OafA/YrhL